MYSSDWEFTETTTLKSITTSYSPKMWQFSRKCTIMTLLSTSLVLTQNKKYNLVIHQHHFLLHNSFPEEFPIYSCFPLRSSNGMAEDPHTKFHTGRIERGWIVHLRRCNAHSIHLYFMGVAAEKPSQFIN